MPLPASRVGEMSNVEGVEKMRIVGGSEHSMSVVWRVPAFLKFDVSNKVRIQSNGILMFLLISE